MMKKADQFPGVDWEAMPFARVLLLTLQDGRQLRLSSFDYWPSQADLVCGGVEELKDGTWETLGYREIPLPNPAIATIEILERGETPTRPSHPEHAYVFPKLKDLYTDTWSYEQFNLT